jgi:hypothetical protein
MPNFAEPVSATFIAISIVLIFVVVGFGIIAVKFGKKSRNPNN